MDAWQWRPSIVIISSRDDARIKAVHEAADFWNAELPKLGTSFRLGAVKHIAGTFDLKAIDSAVDQRRGGTTAPEQLREINGDVIVALSDDEFTSYTRHWPRPRRKTVVGITSVRASTAFNKIVALVAHEFGHVVGLGHSANPDALMCGSPHQCRYPVPQEGFMPLNEAEKTLVHDLYPPSWKEEP